jgi:lactate racemase
MRVSLSYGRGVVEIELPESCEATIIRKPPMPVVADAAGAVERALANPVSAPSIGQLAQGKRSACVLICDITRPVPNRLFLRPMIRRLIDGGIAPDRIKVLVATGLHRPNQGAELAELVGDEWVLETVEVANHFARNDADHVDLGRTRRGTPVKLDRRFVEAEIRIATGLVEPHFMAGWSGGRKVIAPGVAHRDTITRFHSAEFMEHPKAANCSLDGNPLHAEQLEIMEMLGGALALNTVIDEDRRLAFVNFGEVVASHLQAVDFVRAYAEVPIARRFPVVLTSAAGYPLDKTYYQTVKGMVAPLDILEPGGDLIVASACSEGFGSVEFRAAQQRLVDGGPERFLASIQGKRHADIDEWQTEMQLKPMRAGRVHLFSGGLKGEDRDLTGVAMTDSLALTIEHCLKARGTRRIAIVPEGPYVVPVYRPAG